MTSQAVGHQRPSPSLPVRESRLPPSAATTGAFGATRSSRFAIKPEFSPRPLNGDEVLPLLRQFPVTGQQLPPGRHLPAQGDLRVVAGGDLVDDVTEG